MEIEVAVVGGGVVGLAVAAALGRAGRQVIVLEREPALGRGVSSRNSEVVHSGIYYQPGSWKARLCVAGNERLRALGAAGLVPFRATGKLIVATEPAERVMLEELLRLGEQNGVPGLRLLERREVKQLEPAVEALAAIWVPTAAAVDAAALVRYLAAEARRQGALVLCQAGVMAVTPLSAGYRLHLATAAGEETLTARTVVNAAGLHADTLAALAGVDLEAAGYRLEWVKGRYAQLSARAAARLQRHIYPVPAYVGIAPGAGRTAFAGLGVHATVSVDGRVRLGPDVEYLPARVEDYSVPPAVASLFFQAARRFLPFLEPEDVMPESAGIRPRRAVARQGFADFVITEESNRGLPGWINLVGIESPGLTAALPLADVVAELVRKQD
ncbi:MAG: dehydrogenase [Dehalococcoidia bacterium]|nr:MAG: dehydrogenase [Dehalococcoidia bacterium]